MVHLSPIVCIDDAGSENQARSCLVNADLTAICHFLDQFEQVDLEGEKTRVAMVSSNVLYDDLSSTE